MGGMSGFNTLYPYAWFHTAGDTGGDMSHNHANAPDGNFFNDLSQPSGAAHPSAAAAPVLPSAMMAQYPLGINAGYVNSSLQNPGVQAPLPGGPVVMMGPQQGPWTLSDYAAAIPSIYTSAAPPWKNGPMQQAASHLPAQAQAAVHSNATYTPGAAAPAAGASSASAPSTGCAGCGGGCGKGGINSKSFCAGNPHQALQLDSTYDFPPLYSHPSANGNQVVNNYLYQTNSTHRAAWTVAQGAPPDSELPLQGH